MTSRKLILLLFASVGGFTVEAFLPTQSLPCSKLIESDSSSALQMGNLFDDIQNFFNELGGNKKDEKSSQEKETTENRIVTIPGE
jgi:hypothetical protein